MAREDVRGENQPAEQFFVSAFFGVPSSFNLSAVAWRILFNPQLPFLGTAHDASLAQDRVRQQRLTIQVQHKAEAS